MRSQLAFMTVLLASVQAFSQPFTLAFTGGTINFGVAPLSIVVSANGGGTSGSVGAPLPPATSSCTPAEQANLAGSGAFVIVGTTTQFGHLWDVELVFPGPSGAGANLGTLTADNRRGSPDP
jgi:hypothetical protein